MTGSYERRRPAVRPAAAGGLPRNERRTRHELDTFQLGEPVEHRGVVVAPLFPRRDPVAPTSRSTRRCRAGSRSPRRRTRAPSPSSPSTTRSTSKVLLYDGEELVGAKQNRILNVTVLVGAGAKLPIPVSCVEQGRWAGARSRSTRPGTSRTRTCAAARPRRSPRRRSRAESRRARCGTRCATSRRAWTSVADRGDRDTFDAHAARLRRARGRVPARAGPVRRPARASATTSASTGSRAPTRSCSSGRSSAPATCSTRSSGSTGRATTASGSRRSSTASPRARDAQPVGRARRRRPPARPAA